MSTYMYIGACDNNPPAESEIKLQLQQRLAEKISQDILLAIPPSNPKRLCFVYPAAYGELVSIMSAIKPATGTDTLSYYNLTYINMDSVDYYVYTLDMKIDNTDYTTTFNFDNVTPPVVIPTVPPVLVTEPDSHGVVYARSPVIYKYTGCNQNNNYIFNIYITRGSTSELTDIYAYVTRKPDTDNGIMIDASSLIQNFIKNEIEFYAENIVYIMATLVEYSGNEIVSTVISDISRATLGYTKYTDGGGVFNYNEGKDAYVQVDYLMNSNQNDVPYYIPNYGYSRFVYNWKIGSTVDKYRIGYYDAEGRLKYKTYNLSTSFTQCSDEIQTIYCGYYDMVNVHGVNFDEILYYMPLTVQFLIGTDVSLSYPLYPLNCNGNDLTNIQFMNKWGVWERFFCYGRKDTELNVTSETYKYNNVNYDYMTYDTNLGSYHKSFIQGRRGLTVNTGWLDEGKNVKMEELLMSEYVLIETSIGQIKPYIITDKQIKYKTDKWDKMIYYTLTLDEAADAINNIY